MGRQERELNAGVIETFELVAEPRPEADEIDAAFYLWGPEEESMIVPLWGIYQGRDPDGADGLWLRLQAESFVMPCAAITLEYEMPNGEVYRHRFADPRLQERLTERVYASGLVTLELVNQNRRLLGLEPQTPESAGLVDPELRAEVAR